MFSAIRLVPNTIRNLPWSLGRATPRAFSSQDNTLNNDVFNFDTFTMKPPKQLTTEMAEGIGEATQFYVRYGVANQRLKALAQDFNMPIVTKWQKMMEVFLVTQVHVIGGMGYTGDESGLTQYASDLAACLQQVDPTMQELFREVRRDTWRELVATCFGLEVNEIPTLSIADARNVMHKVSTKMIDPETLLAIQTRTAKIEDSDVEVEVAQKHQVLQDIIVNRVYLGGSPPLVEETGFGKGAQGYAKLQCAMSDHEGDPLIAEYASAGMIKIWGAAGLDINSIHGPGLPAPE